MLLPVYYWYTLNFEDFHQWRARREIVEKLWKKRAIGKTEGNKDIERQRDRRYESGGIGLCDLNLEDIK